MQCDRNNLKEEKLSWHTASEGVGLSWWGKKAWRYTWLHGCLAVGITQHGPEGKGFGLELELATNVTGPPLITLSSSQAPLCKRSRSLQNGTTKQCHRIVTGCSKHEWGWRWLRLISLQGLREDCPEERPRWARECCWGRSAGQLQETMLVRGVSEARPRRETSVTGWAQSLRWTLQGS